MQFIPNGAGSRIDGAWVTPSKYIKINDEE